MGVDGVLSSGFVFVPIPYTMSFQADSASNLVFDTWWAQMVSTRQTYQATMTVKLPSVATKYSLKGGVLTSYKPSANAKRLLQPRTFEVTFGGLAVAPA